jgi:LmbE family N-acetylglucosaminyl deacetylase
MQRILAIGAHPDDIEIHCSGYLLQNKEKDNIYFSLIMSASPVRKKEAIKSSEITQTGLIILDYKDGSIRETPEMIDSISELIDKNKIGTVFTHWQHDYHQDHRAVAYATQAACRGKKICLWQYPDNSFMFLNDAFNVTVDIENVMEEKRKLLDVFKSQKDKFYIKEAKKLTKEFFKVSANL